MLYLLWLMSIKLFLYLYFLIFVYCNFSNKLITTLMQKCIYINLSIRLQGQSRRGRKLTVEHICLKTFRISCWITFRSFLPIGSPVFEASSSAFSYSSLKSHLSNTSLVFMLAMTRDILLTCSFNNQSEKGLYYRPSTKTMKDNKCEKEYFPYPNKQVIDCHNYLATPFAKHIYSVSCLSNTIFEA